ncbi:MAG: hypothetical protein ACI8TA_001402 [Cyclobacteriaceae bacterium]|jgi:hypothetical protein
MTHDYQLLLENLQGRRFDEARRESIYSETFEESDHGDCIKYCLESMHEIDPAYAYKAFHVARKLQEKLLAEFHKKNIKVDFRYQGPIQTETHIMLYGGIELIVLQESFDNRPWQSVKKLTGEIIETLSADPSYHRVDYSDKYHINVITTKPTCEINILPAIWLDNAEFIKTKREIDRGIWEFNFQKKTQKKYLPFKNIARINSKDRLTNGGLKSIIRLLRTLQRDSTDNIELSNHEISSLIYAVPDKQMIFNPKKSLALLGIASAQLNRAAKDQKYVEELISPSERERVFGKKQGKIEEIKKLKNALDKLLSDIKEELKAEQKTVYSELTY